MSGRIRVVQRMMAFRVRSDGVYEAFVLGRDSDIKRVDPAEASCRVPKKMLQTNSPSTLRGPQVKGLDVGYLKGTMYVITRKTKVGLRSG